MKNQLSRNTNDSSFVCPTTVLPQRRKRRRINCPTIKNECINHIDTVQEAPQLVNDTIELNRGSSESATSLASPIQEIGCLDQIFPYIGDMFASESLKFNDDFPFIEDLSHLLGIKGGQQHGLLTPTLPELSFFE